MRTWTIPAVLLFVAVPGAAQQAPPSHELERSVDSGTFYAPAASVAYALPVEVSGAAWMQLVFARLELPGRALLRITSARDGAVHELDATSAAQWQHRSAYMNGDLVFVEVLAEPGTGPLRVVLERVVVGLPQQNASTCGTVDDRQPSSDRRIARLMPSGCTGWLIDDCNKGFLSAGHCYGVGAAIAMFRVPLSTDAGVVQMSAPEDQYPIDPASSQFQHAGLGADWWYFGCFANSNTGLTPFERTGHAFVLEDVATLDAGAPLRVTGHGSDFSPPQWNYVQQTSTGPWTELSTSAIGHQVDTQSGNSGSPVILQSSGRAIAIHTHAGCTDTVGSNYATRVGAAALQSALASPRGVLACDGSWSTYCSAKVNSQGCLPQIAATANPSASGGPGSCVVVATNVLNHQSGVFFYGRSPAAIPFQGGTLCVVGNVRRTGIVGSGGSAQSADCSGSYAFDLGAWIASGVDAGLVRGATIVGQFWSRDPASAPYPSGLSAGIRLTIGP